MHARYKGGWQILLAASTTALVLAAHFVERQREHTLRVDAQTLVREHLLIIQARLESQLNGVEATRAIRAGGCTRTRPSSPSPSITLSCMRPC